MRVAVVLAIASMLILAAVADEASAQKYAKKAHNKHEKEYKDKPEGHKHDKPDGYKPNGYKPDGYRPDSYKEYEYGKNYRPGYNGYEPEGYSEEYSNYNRRPYEPNGYDYDYKPMDGYGGQPSPYDGGYWGGSNGRQIIHLQSVYAERLLNTTLTDGGRIGRQQRCSEDNQGPCDMDFGLICALRHHESDGYGKSDYATGKFGPAIQGTPRQPVAIALANVNYEPVTRANGGRAIDDLVILNGYQVGYKWANVNGYINFEDGAQACHPLLGPNTKVTFNQDRVPVYLMFGKIRLPVDPAMAIPFGGFYPFSPDTLSKAQVLGAQDSESEHKTTPEGNKYKVEDNYAYLLNEKDNTLCGLSIVAKGGVSLTVDPPGNDATDATVYSGTMEWPIMWSDFVTTLPLLLSDRYATNRQAVPEPNQGPLLPGPFQPFPIFDSALGAGFFEQWLGKTLDRFAAMCKSNSDIPWIAPGSFTMDVARVRTV